MGRKFCVFGCRSGYDAKDKTSVFRLPKNKEERQRWLKALPRDNVPDSKDTVVSEKHWPKNYETVLHYGKCRPLLPPTVFDCVPKSLVPTRGSSKRSTIKATSSQRIVEIDEKSEFLKADTIPVTSFAGDVNTFVKLINDRPFKLEVIAYASNGSVIIQSTTLNVGIPLFSIVLKNDFTFHCYHLGIKLFIPSLTTNKITKMNRWSVVEEAMSYLSSVEMTNKHHVLNDYRMSMSSSKIIGSKVYSPAMLVRAFEYFSCSRAAYELFRKDHQLPSRKTLTQITSKVTNSHNLDFLDKVFDALPSKQKQVVLMLDEIYVKASMTYHVWQNFWKS